MVLSSGLVLGFLSVLKVPLLHLLCTGWRPYGGNRGGLHRSASHYGPGPHKQRRDRQHANHPAVRAGTLTHAHGINAIRLAQTTEEQRSKH